MRRALLEFLQKYQLILAGFICVALSLFFSTYHLLESPKTWFDEGIFIQIARNIPEHGSYVLRSSPTTVVPASLYTTVGFPVLFPISCVFSLFGIGLLQARIVMVAYLLALTIVCFLFCVRTWGFRGALISTLLLVTHAPVYGNGKNVLGEVPGLVFFFSLLWCLKRLEAERGASLRAWIGTGFFAGLFMATKPNFFVLVPVLACVLWMGRRRVIWGKKQVLSAILAFLIPMGIYTYTQFGFMSSPIQILKSYTSLPGLEQVTGLTLPNLILKNLLLFVQDATPAYLLVTFGMWSFFLALRFFRKKSSSLHEYVAYGVAALTILYFLKMPGFFRYLFVAQVITFPYVVAACQDLILMVFPDRLTFRRTVSIFLTTGWILLCLFQGYQVLFRSWVAGYYRETRTQELTQYFNALDPTTHIFLYHAPEVATFIHGEQYSQYFELLYFQDAFGKDQLSQLAAGVPDLIVVAESELARAQPFLSLYTQTHTLNHGNYLMYERK